LSARATTIELPEKLAGLFKPYRYKVIYGGRGSAKSWSVARALLTIAASKPTRILCGREFQRSMKDSVHKLLADQIDLIGMTRQFTVTATSIVSTCDSEFIFTGLRHNAATLKSLEGVDIAWVEQAERLSKNSLDILVPTVRKEGSEIWFTLNPELEEDEVYKRFVIGRPANALVIEQNWRDNPWFTSVLKAEMEEMRRRDPDGWLNIYEGKPLHALQGAIYARELREAAEQGRITKVPVVGGTPVHTAWDLGHSDNTAIWFFQRVGFEYRMVDFFSDNAQKLDHYLKALQQRGYLYGRHYLPHDAESNRLEGKSVANQVRDVYGKANVHVVPRTDSVVGDLNICRTVFEQVWFDQEKCADGLNALRHYRYKVDPDTGRTSREPLHDWTSDTADAFRTFAIGFRQERRDSGEPRKPKVRTMQAGGGPSQAWMGA
jgi:phage terminase large subunit